ncbi:MAG: 5-(carboxyamino)imidazole ribonucleotide mutase [Gammaproteobacteria bacterium]|jgi:phosphoribosylaminoimidazole carboxylase PurE protein
MTTKSSRVSIVMGSQSDLPIMRDAGLFLTEIGIAHELDIVSAHRTPKRLQEYAEGLLERGIEVVIAGAGGAAHLPGMIAAVTVLPVIGVPVATTKLDGYDSLLSIVQMPRGVPVATVAIDNAGNAAVLAAQIIAVHDAGIRTKLIAYKKALEDKVLAMSAECAYRHDPNAP